MFGKYEFGFEIINYWKRELAYFPLVELSYLNLKIYRWIAVGLFGFEILIQVKKIDKDL